jgi:hypothetical protein
MELAEASRRSLAAPNGVNDALMRCHFLRRRRRLRNCCHLDAADALGGLGPSCSPTSLHETKAPFHPLSGSPSTTQSEAERMPRRPRQLPRGGRGRARRDFVRCGGNRHRREAGLPRLRVENGRSYTSSTSARETNRQRLHSP